MTTLLPGARPSLAVADDLHGFAWRHHWLVACALHLAWPAAGQGVAA